MRRDPRLHGLSHDHRRALALAREVRIQASEGRWSEEAGADLKARFERLIGPHFVVEEEVLLDGLEAVGSEALAARTFAEHAALRALLPSASQGDGEAAARFAALLHDHIRFEERELFPACEERLDAAVLEEAKRRAPPDEGRSC